MPSLIPHGASARRLTAAAGLLAALSAGPAPADPQPRPGPGAEGTAASESWPIPEAKFWLGPGGRPVYQAEIGPEVPPTPGELKAAAYDQILMGRALRGEVPFPGRTPDPDGAGTGPGEESGGPAPLPCFRASGGWPISEDRVLGATLMLMATYEIAGPEPGARNGYFGTGTVIRADEGLNRVLTAAHVTSPEMIDRNGAPIMLRSVYAFDGEGRLVAELGLSYAHTGRIRFGSISQELVQQDVAVLAPVRFPSEEMARSWQGRGVEIAPEQSGSVLFFYGQGGASLITGGFSGAALYNPDGQVVGLITETVQLEETVRPAPNTVMPEAVLTQDLSRMGMRDRERLMQVAASPSEGVFVDSVAAGPPLSGRGLLTALGVDPGRISTVPFLGTTGLYTAGFPGMECRETWVRQEPRPDVPFEERPGAHTPVPVPDPIVFSDLPGHVQTMGPDGALSEPERVGVFFGARDFFATIDALTRASTSGVKVEDPFAPNAPEESPEGPQ